MEQTILIQTGKEEDDFRRLRSYEPGEREIIAACFERAWKARTSKNEMP